MKRLDYLVITLCAATTLAACGPFKPVGTKKAPVQVHYACQDGSVLCKENQ